MRNISSDAHNFHVLFARIALGFRHPVVLGDRTVLTTILMGTCVYVQGLFVRRLSNGLVTVRVGEQLFTGRPVGSNVAA